MANRYHFGGIVGHFASGDHFDAGDYFGGGTDPLSGITFRRNTGQRDKTREQKQ